MFGKKICLSIEHILLLSTIYIVYVITNNSLKKSNGGSQSNNVKNSKHNELKDSPEVLNKDLNNKQIEIENNIEDSSDSEKDQIIIIPKKKSNYKIKQIRNRDYSILYDKLRAPERRLSSDMYINNRSLLENTNISTRGLIDGYQLMGIVFRNSTNTIFNLFGRQRHRGSSLYDYYISGSSDNTSIKIPIGHNKELMNGEELIIPELNPSKGAFEVRLYEIEELRYNPFIF